MSDPQDVAEASARCDVRAGSRLAGARHADPGNPSRLRALAMTVREDMVNGHKICHGGLIFTLADSAFAFACNTL